MGFLFSLHSIVSWFPTSHCISKFHSFRTTEVRRGSAHFSFSMRIYIYTYIYSFSLLQFFSLIMKSFSFSSHRNGPPVEPWTPEVLCRSLWTTICQRWLVTSSKHAARALTKAGEMSPERRPARNSDWKYPKYDQS